ncbi:hypothetical protein M406DRAFT_338600 [Cryphonectria parasitica EP155]|uniref:Digeranylgeranylglyceryl phosphate synthase n=1 Tax=Cryphonectria parasitica (strain ATCC 38755 / EP155) TaxID=660469 RepID=A0A9P4Y7I0_CRYP1|nr:uncharacterized protein M406DRAFT_338600 [Cryphonectria parasitica EP155]KAF3767921.1 hypothetical protein M406DRAFT_338600 [Cryphonectria parasitica EP155]
MHVRIAYYNIDAKFDRFIRRIDLAQTLLFSMRLLWDFIESDFFTFAIPNTVFGFFGALASPVLVQRPPFSGPHSPWQLSCRLPSILAFNVANLLIFDLANQRAPSAVAEDRINKPWRPIPRGKITTDQTRRLMLAAVPQGILIHILTWMYNDLGGGDEAFVRGMIISVAYGMFNSGSLQVAVGPEQFLSTLGITWTTLISGVILTTMQVQDLKDREGDRTRGRKTIVLFLGEHFSRTSIAFFVCFWSCMSIFFWRLGPVLSLLYVLLAAVVMLRVLFIYSSKQGDARTWRWWCLWHASLYTLPLLKLVS